MQNLTDSLKTDGRKSIQRLMKRKELEAIEVVDFQRKFQSRVASLARKRFEEASREAFKESRKTKLKGGARLKMSDEQAVYLRTECKNKTVTALCKELNITYSTAYNCIKGMTYKHLDAICPPQF